MARQMARYRVVVLLLTGLGFASPSRAAEWPVARGASHEPAPYLYDPAQWKKVPKEFLEDASACILYSGTTYLVEADGTIEAITHEITRFNGRKGIDKLGEFRNIVFDPTYQKLTLNEARVHKTNGQVAAIDANHVQLRDLSTDYQVYDHDKQLVISFPSLEVGDVIEVKWTTRGKNPEHQGYFFTRYSFGDDTYPVVLDDLRVRLPKDKVLKHATIGRKMAPEVEEKNGWKTFLWQAHNCKQLPLDDNLPSKEDMRLQVALSTFPSWEEVGAWKGKLRKDCWECTEEIRKVVAEVTKDLTKPLEKARALTYWARRNIRYVSVGEKHDYTPHAPSQVLSSRYGDCKDQSQLLAVMLREAGIPVGLATLGTLDEGQVLEDHPSPWGTHAILLVTLDGHNHWIDTTATFAGWDYLPREDRDRLCYVVDDKGLRLVRTPAVTPEDNKTEQITHVFVGASGSSRCERAALYTGNAAMIQRDNWLETPAGERRRLLTAELQDANSHARLKKLLIDEKSLRDFDAPVQAAIRFEIANHFSGDPDLEGSVTDSKVWSKLLSFNLDYDRKSALELGTPFESIHRYVLHLPPVYRLESLPSSQTVRSRWGSFTLKVKAEGEGEGKIHLSRIVELEMHTRLDKIRVEPADFEEFRKFHEDVGKHYRVWLVLKPTRDLADAPALETLLTWMPTDAGYAAALARLYLAHGMSKEARRVLRRARYYQPRAAALWELSIKASDSVEDLEAIYREMVRLFPEEAKYAVALGATLVDRGKHLEASQVLGPVAQDGSAAIKSNAFYHLARNALAENKADEALANLEQAGQADPDSLNHEAAWLFRAQVQEKRGAAKEAMTAYRQVRTLNQESEEALAALVRLALETGDKVEALDTLRQYTLAVLHDGAGLAQAADWHLQMGRYEDALDLASRSRELGFHEKAQRVLGLVYLHKKDYAKSIHHLEKALPEEPILAGLTRAFLAVGKLEEAADQKARLEKIDKPTPQTRGLCAEIKSLLDRRQQILAGQTIRPGDLPAWKRAIGCLVCAESAFGKMGPGPGVEKLLEGATVKDVDFAASHGLRALLALEKGRLGKALAEADRAIELGPKEARGYYVRGRVRLERGTAKSLEDLAKAVELSGRKDPDMLHWLATALARMGKSEDALAAQREAVQLKPGDAELAEQLRELEKAGKTGGAGN